ncbi:electron transport complex subunit RsxE [candidate division WOR-3 bacterium JGI_Cruoil_03_51_56]|uniref:Ion-translocating oxidoreductase complex subunit E n=1 Tax=candidate division WOR-3 bacterium JGI_Cruoil_03_51_56 TaxID=1973747 RepID=A0A235BVD1_UNCW3|nr:MAG: electron transport complex subunit RsxE [candidate division WOR-3 bacterium JGI_Cruoil_03_51_56]
MIPENRPSRLKYFTSGIILENPILILMIGLCPTLATSVTAQDGLGMGIAASFVLICSNFVISLIRKIIPSSIRIPIFIIIISSFVTIIDYVLQAFEPGLYQVLGVFVPLIVVNCIILGRAEAFAYHHGIIDSILDALGKAVGFTLVIVLMGIIREFFSAGTIFGAIVTPAGFRQSPVLFMIFPPGAFLLIGILKSIVNRLNENKGK